MSTISTGHAVSAAVSAAVSHAVPAGQSQVLPETQTVDPRAVGRWQHRLPDGRVQCDLCPRYCKLREGQRGFCFVRS